MVRWNEIYNEIYICQALPDLFDGKRGLIFSVFIAPSSVGLCNPGLLRNLHGHAQTANRAIVHFSASALLVATFRWHGSCSDKFGVVSSCHLPIHQKKKKGSNRWNGRGHRLQMCSNFMHDLDKSLPSVKWVDGLLLTTRRSWNDGHFLR